MRSVGRELWSKGRSRARWRSISRWNRGRRWKPSPNWRRVYELKRKSSAFGSATGDTGRDTWNRSPHQILHRSHRFRPRLWILSIPPTCRQFNQQVLIITKITKYEHCTQFLLFAAELSPSVQDSLRPSVQDSLRPSVQDSTVSSGTPNKRAVLEGSPKDALEKHFAMEPKPSLATIAWLADSLRMKAEVVRTWFGNRRCKEKRMKKFTTLMTPMRQTRLSASRVLRSGDIADETAETSQFVNGNNSAG